MNRFRATLLVAFALLLGSMSIAQDTIVQATILGEDEIEADRLYNSGISQFQNKNYKAAINDFTKSLDLREDFEPAYFNRAVCKSEVEDFAGAISDLAKLLV